MARGEARGCHEIASKYSSDDRLIQIGDAMITLPDWTPTLVRPLLRQLDRSHGCKGQRHIVFERLLTDRRMMSVYEQFFRRKRKTGEFFYSAKRRKPNQTPEQAQLAGLRQVLMVAISAAGDRMSASKLEELDNARKRWVELAAQLRVLAHDLTLAIELRQLGIADRRSRRQAARDIVGLVHVANWLDSQVAALRRPGDPLLVKKHRGDPIVRAVQTLVGLILQEQFGARLDGTAATLAGAALGTTTSARVSRSALTAKNSKKKRTAR